MMLTVADIVLVGMNAALCWLGYFYLYKRFITEAFEQKVQEIRDAVFDFAADGHISFYHPTYVLLQKTIGGMARQNGDEGALLVAFAGMRGYLGAGPTGALGADWGVAVAGVDRGIEAKLGEFRSALRRAITVHCFLGSPVAACCAFAFGTFSGAAKKGMRSLFKCVM